MGSASRVTPGRPHSDSLAASLPIENSPPGIHTMPGTAGVGTGVLLEIVGAKGEAAPACSLFCMAKAAREARDERYLTKAPTPTTTINAATIQRTCPVLGARAGLCPPRVLSGCLLMACLFFTDHRLLNTDAGSEVHLHPGLENVEVAFGLEPGDMSEAVVEPPLHVR